MKTKNYIALIILYFIAHFLTLLNKGLFYDDWAIYNASYHAVISINKDGGLPFLGYIQWFILNLPHPVEIFHWLNFGLNLGALLLFVCSIDKLKMFDVNKTFIFGCLIAVMPMVTSQFLIIIFIYSACWFLFQLGFYYTVSFVYEQTLQKRLGILFLFFFSFFFNSMLLFYAIPLCILFILPAKANIRTFFTKYADFILLPVLFWIVKSLLFKPSGQYALENYNQITIGALLSSPKQLIIAFQANFLYMFGYFLELIKGNLFLFILVCSVITWVFIPSPTKAIDVKIKIYRWNISRNKLILLTGLLIYALGTLPYILVKKGPTYSGYATRHQFLLPIGSALIIIGVIEILIMQNYRKIAYAFICGCAIVLNFTFYLNYEKNWFKQVAIIENAKTMETLNNYTTYYVADSTTKINEGDNTNAHTFNAIFKYATGAEDKLILTREKYQELIKAFGSLDKMLTDPDQLCCKDWKPSPFQAQITILPGTSDFTSLKNSLKLLYLEWLKPQAFKQEAKKLVGIKITALQ